MFRMRKRGGISICITKHSTANNEYIPNKYNPNCPQIFFILTVDANNLYGWAMSGYMLYSDFTWVDSIENIDILNVPNNSEMGYILEVNIWVHLHDVYMDLLFLPINKCTEGSKQTKLLITLELKQKYICHCINLKQAVTYRLKITKIHRAIQCPQTPWLKPYIDLNTQKRWVAKNDFEFF